MKDINSSKKEEFIEALNNWYRFNKRSYKWRDTKIPYNIGVAEILLQKTNADKVVPVYDSIVQRYPTELALSSAAETEVLIYLRDIGLYNRASTLIVLSNYIKDCSLNNLELSAEGLLRIKGVGLYIANSILVHSKNIPLPLLDPNIIRIYNRVYGIKSTLKRPRTDKKLWDVSLYLLPQYDYSNYYFALLDFGALICKPKPLCSICCMSNNICPHRSSAAD